MWVGLWVCVCGRKKELPLCVWVIYICVFSPFSVSIAVERGEGRGGEDLQQTFSAFQLLNLGKHSCIYRFTVHTQTLFVFLLVYIIELENQFTTLFYIHIVPGF